MFYHIFPNKDATIYEYSQSLNSGIDPIIEIEKKVVSNSLYNSRILIAFDLTDISSSIQAGTITDPRFDLVFYMAEAKQIRPEYTLYAYPLYQSWSMGTGRRDNYPQTQNGASWLSTDSADNRWITGSFPINVTGSSFSNAGGGSWYTSSAASQSFTYRGTNDMSMHVSDIVFQWLSGSITNNGFIIKRSDADEQSTVEEGIVRFFGLETNTIFVPSLRIGWDDSSFATGSLLPFTLNEGIVYIPNLKSEYSQFSKEKIRIYSRPQHPTRSFSLVSQFLQNYYLPATSYYSIVDATTDTAVIPFDDVYTKISCDATSNFFNFWFDSLFPERNYKFRFKVVSNGETRYYDNKFTFKVVR